MPSLRELQDGMRRTILDGPVEGLGASIAEDGLAAEARLDVYRHHVRTTLTAVLAGTFPVIRRLVDARFFAYAADAFIRLHPPSSPCLFEYGAAFPRFLADFPACRHLVYLADVARLEWALQAAAHAEDTTPLAASALARVAPAEVAELRFAFDPSLSLLRSPWPIDRIWGANQPGMDGAVALDDGAVWLQVRRRDDAVGFRRLDEAEHALRRALLDGERLDGAASSALAVDPAFDLAAALAALLREGVLVATR